MKITELVKQLNSLKRKHGDLNVRIDASSIETGVINEEICVRPLAIAGVFKVTYEDLARPRKEVLLVDENSDSSIFEEQESL